MLRSVVDVDVLLKAITINNVLRLQVSLRIDRLSVTQSKRIIVQWPTKRFPYRNVLASSVQKFLCVLTMSESDLPDYIIGRDIDVSHDVGLTVRVALSCRDWK